MLFVGNILYALDFFSFNHSRILFLSFAFALFCVALINYWITIYYTVPILT